MSDQMNKWVPPRFECVGLVPSSSLGRWRSLLDQHGATIVSDHRPTAVDGRKIVWRMAHPVALREEARALGVGYDWSSVAPIPSLPEPRPVTARCPSRTLAAIAHALPTASWVEEEPGIYYRAELAPGVWVRVQAACDPGEDHDAQWTCRLVHEVGTLPMGYPHVYLLESTCFAPEAAVLEVLGMWRATQHPVHAAVLADCLPPEVAP